jgi:hypothetical protein
MAQKRRIKPAMGKFGVEQKENPAGAGCASKWKLKAD